jgi:peptidoglycan/xylan/chitin deacetylase (PgdA/CDA1 family)
MTTERADDSPKWILRRTVKAAIAAALCAAGARAVVRTLRRREAGGRRVLVLSYHRVSLDFRSDAAESLPSLLVSAETLHRQLAQLARERDVVSLADACRILAERPSAPPGRPPKDVAVVTFDDGYVGVHRHGLPVLEALRMPATVFMATGFAGTRRRLAHDRLWAALRELWRRRIPPARAGLGAGAQEAFARAAGEGPATSLDRMIARLPHDDLLAIADALEARLALSEDALPDESRLMTWDELRACEAGGVAVGGHTVRHAALANLPPSQARAEILGCMRHLEEHLGPAVRHFAYPNGYYTPAVKRMVADAGFAAAVTTEDLENRIGADPFTLKRKVLWENSSLGLAGYSEALAACNLDGVFGALGWQRPVTGERPDAPPDPPGADARRPEPPRVALVQG